VLLLLLLLPLLLLPNTCSTPVTRPGTCTRLVQLAGTLASTAARVHKTSSITPGGAHAMPAASGVKKFIRRHPCNAPCTADMAYKGPQGQCCRQLHVIADQQGQQVLNQTWLPPQHACNAWFCSKDTNGPCCVALSRSCAAVLPQHLRQAGHPLLHCRYICTELRHMQDQTVQ
jgi:hypothetical protein